MIVRILEVMPEKPTDRTFEYDGTKHVIFSGSEQYTIKNAAGDVLDEIAATDVGKHEFTVTLNGDRVWAEDGSTAAVTVALTITKPKLVINSFTQEGWQAGEMPPAPVIDSKPALSADEYTLSYRAEGSSTWSTTRPSSAGMYEVKLTVKPSDNFEPPDGDDRVATFSIWEWVAPAPEHDIDALGYRATITVTGYEGEALADFPMLVKLAENAPAGFHYRHARADGSDLRFLDAAGNPLAYEIDEWNTDGESYVWVKMPVYEKNAAVTMFWGELVDKTLPDTPASTDVWKDYVGVWHMREAITVADAATTKSLDSTAHANHATPTKGSAATADLSQMISLDAPVGNGRINSSVTSVQKGNRLLTTQATSLGGAFTFSGWYKMFAKGNYPRLVGNKADNKASGWSIETVGNSSTRLVLRDNSGKTVDYGKDCDDMVASWVHLAFVFNGTAAKLYSNGREVASLTISAIANTSNKLAFGADSNGSEWSLNGAYDELRLRSGTVSADWARADHAQMTGSVLTYGPTFIRPDSTFINRWLVPPSIGKKEWYAGTEPPAVSAGVPVYGASYYVFANVSGAPVTNAVPTAAGEYGFSAHVPAGRDEGGSRGWAALDADFGSVYITVSSPYQDLKGDGSDVTSAGRVLLANDFDGDGQKIADQSYWLTNPADSEFGSYWVHSEDSTVPLQPHLMKGTKHELVHATAVDALCGSTILWYLENVRIGNDYPASLAMSDKRNYLPWSPYAKAISSTAGPTGAQEESAHLVLRNRVGATIYSPCYTNGIGTVYFDAVNVGISEDGEGYGLVLEIATNSVVDGVSFIPTDENVFEFIPEHKEEENLGGGMTVTNTIAAVTNRFGRAVWHPVLLQPLVKNGTEGFVPGVATDELLLAINNGGSYANFYRVYAQIDYRGPARFRLRRSSANSSTVVDSVADFILVDNIAVSYPSMRADLSSYGTFDPAKSGKQTLGQELAWSVPFPSVSDEVLARAKPVYSVNPGDLSANTDNFVVSAKLFYRWRYLDQMFDPVDKKSWKSVGLDPANGFTALSPLDLPEGLVGDVEYWYEMHLNAPFYNYYDYSGAGLDLGGHYSENTGVVTNRAAAVDMKESRGTDWFVRLREGSSDVEAVNLVLRTGTTTEEVVDGDVTNTVVRDVTRTIPMELIDDHVWRGYLPTPTNVAPRVEYRFELLNRQTPGSTSFETNTNLWFNGADLNTVPVSSVLADAEASQWSPLAVDSATGYFMFQIDDKVRSVTVLHADYQNFNSWSDAKGDLFVGSSTLYETNRLGEVVGTSREKQDYAGAFGEYLAMPSTNANWIVPSVSWTDTAHLGNHAPYKTFATDTSDAWQVGQGMWVSKWYRDSTLDAGVALQMEGQGRGFLQLTDKDVLPRGIETVSFNARLGQFVNFSDFAYYDADSKLSMSNYTFTARGAFDLNQFRDFRGNASLSLIAYYRPGKGCYEFRFEQVNAKWTNGKADFNPKGQTLSLYRWKYDATGRMNATLLGSRSYTNTWFDIPRTSGSGGSYLPLYLSVSNVTDKAVFVSAGVGRSRSGMAPGGIAGITSFNFANIYCHDTADALTSGTYGVLSANCDGVFLSPHRMKPIGFKEFGENNLPAANTVKVKDNVKPGFNTATETLHSCRQEITDDLWVVTPGRMEIFDMSGTVQWGLRASQSASQRITLYTAPAGKTEWKEKAHWTIDGFGSISSLQDCKVDFHSPEPLSIRLAVDGTVEDVRRDVVIDSFEVKQWGATDWDDYQGAGQYVRPHWESSLSDWGLSNFVFTSGWTLDGSLLLSAKRTKTDEPAAIRSPLMDGYTYWGGESRGRGLGMFSFTYKNAQPNVNLLLQIATNNVTAGTVGNLNNFDASTWTTVTNFNFTADTPDRSSGTRSAYIGLHGVSGVMRLVIDPAVVEAAQNSTDQKYGSIEITEVFCRDEPNLDDLSWWGWNLRTVGPDTNGRDDERRMYLPDLTRSGVGGLSLALNNSITDKTVETDEDAYKNHMPFVQTPTFGTNVVGSVTFRARNYPGDASTAYVGIYGCESGLVEDDRQWTFLTNIAVKGATYSTYSYTTDPGLAFAAFRLGVTGVEGVAPVRGELPGGLTKAARVLLDEVVVSEAIRARMAFRNVGAFHSDMNGTDRVPNVPSRDEQPLCNEGWGVQCEIFPAQLADEINFAREPVVVLHWFDGDWPWGFENWRTHAKAKSARLAAATGTNLVYRSSNVTAPEAVIPMSTSPGSVVQYMLEVRYWQKGSTVAITNYLEAGEWPRPDWYRPVDYNRDYGSFSAYSIQDTVSPGWAWINEVNILGLFDENFNNSGRDAQFVEIAVPQAADITGWSVRLLAANQWSSSVVTNVIGSFGSGGLGGTKAVQKYAASNMVFRVLGSPDSHESHGGALDPDEGEIDAMWWFENLGDVFQADNEISAMDPVGIQLVRASGVVEHEILCVGTNFFGTMLGLEQYYDPQLTADYLNGRMKESRFFYAGEDVGGYPSPAEPSRDASLGVMTGRGEAAANWANAVLRTPGKVNIGQEIVGEPPTPNGETIIVYANVDNSFGRITQTVGDAVKTNGTQMIFIKRGSTVGTNIVYHTERWHVLDSVTTNNVALDVSGALTGPRTYTVNVGAGVSNNVTVVARARMNDDLTGKYGLTDDNPYTPAVLDWLMKGTDVFGNPFANPDADAISLAEFWKLPPGGKVADLTLTEMYWLDMDPTVSNLVLRGGVSKAAQPHPVEIVDYDGSVSVRMNVRMGVKLYVTNRTDDVSSDHYGDAWTPYVMRGLGPGENSLAYDGNGANWTSATFKVTGLINNGLTSWSDPRNWVGLRWFVFNENSFHPLDGSDAAAESLIEIVDPYSTESPGYTAGWYDWLQNHPNDPAPAIFYSWRINDARPPFSVEALLETNYYDNVQWEEP